MERREGVSNIGEEKEKGAQTKNAYSPQTAGGPMKKPPTPAVTVNRHRAAGEG